MFRKTALALGLLLGGRADSGAVRSGSRQARVEGVVRISGLPAVAEAVAEVGGEVEDDRVLLARTVAAEGRSRAFVGGASVPVARLAEAESAARDDAGRDLSRVHLELAELNEALFRAGVAPARPAASPSDAQ